MTTPYKLNAGQKHMLNLIAKGQNKEGWTPVSAPVYPLLKSMPTELIELQSIGDEGRGQARLTQEGQSLLNAMAWL